MNLHHIKKELYNLCLAYVENRINTANNAIVSAREAANDDTKSSAGDKYETGRAMMQQEIDFNSRQLNEAGNLKQALSRIVPDKQTDIVQLGSLAITNHGTFYIAISAGQLFVEDKNYFAISTESPIGSKLVNQKARAEFTFNGRLFKIETVY